MSLYPDGHPPLISCGAAESDQQIINIAHEPSLQHCLNSADTSYFASHMFLERLRAQLFRAEQLMETQPLPATGYFMSLPQDIAVLLATLNAAQQCLEAWLESTTCQRILEAYPR